MLALSAFILLLIVSVFVIDDLIIDLYAFLKQLKPKKLSKTQLDFLCQMPEKNIAIIVANWHEHDVIGRMIAGNLKRINYKNVHFFIGVYPNDLETGLAAAQVCAAFPRQVHVVVNTKPGPTSKGQMLNEITRDIFRKEPELGLDFDVFLMHDSEDILHPLSLKIINAEITQTDFLQIPVFSFDRPVKDWVGSTYIDEFAEIHTKDMFVRQSLGAPVPSAGVGTAIQRKLMITLMKENEGDFLRDDSLTEDYVLGMSSAIKGFKTSFCCYYTENEKGEKDFIATREYFPNKFKAAVRQKTRWILGIAFQGQKMIPWFGTIVHKYFLYRDRKGPVNNIIAICTTVLSAYLLCVYLYDASVPEFMSEEWFKWGSVIATTGMISRLYHRMKAVYIINGWKRVLAVPLRWPLGNLINFMATLRAIKEYRRAIIKKEPLKWAKTTHELPENFGHHEEAPLP